MEKVLDNACLLMTNTLVTKTKGFAMKFRFAGRLASLVLAAVLFAPIAISVAGQAAQIVA